jgi:membrane protease YdiL (CAAX protease family)
MSHLVAPSVRLPRGGSIAFAIGLVVAHLFVLFGLGGLVAQALHLDRETVFEASPAAFVALAISAVLEIGLVYAVLLRRVGGLSLRDVGWTAPRARDAALGILGFVACAAVMLGMLVAIGVDPGEIADDIASYAPAQRVFFLLLGLLAAASEETIFRGVLQPALQRRLGRATGILVGAAIFSVYHLQFAPFQLFGKLAFGVVLGTLRDRTGTLWASGIAHALIWVAIGNA